MSAAICEGSGRVGDVRRRADARALVACPVCGREIPTDEPTSYGDAVVPWHAIVTP